MATQDEMITSLMEDVTGHDEPAEPHKIAQTISDILKEYNLRTDMTFVEKIAKMNIGNGKKEETIDIGSMPKELQDAAFLPVNCITDIALRQDLDMVVSQIPELFKSLQIARDAICESDVVTGRLARNIKFDKTNVGDTADDENRMSKIEDAEERLDIDSMIKNHVVFDSLFYGESYLYAIPYSKVFSDLYTYKTKNKGNGSAAGMFETSSMMNGYGEHANVEVSLYDTIVTESASNNKGGRGVYTESVDPSNDRGDHIFTEAEIREINPEYHAKIDDAAKKKERKERDDSYDKMLDQIARDITYIGDDIALPVIEESGHDLRCSYDQKYQDRENFITEASKVFQEAMESNPTTFEKQFERVKGLYVKPLPATKLIPVRIDHNIIGYYYASDMTRPEQGGQRRNSGLSGYTLRSPAVGYDNFSPDQMFCNKLATKIINNFDIKFMRDNVALHQQIVSILQAHKFNESMLRFVFIPAENVVPFIINKDGAGKGHSILEPGLVTARMYMFLNMYSLLYQINNSEIRVYNLASSGIDKDYKQMVQETVRKFAARRITANDIFNYRSSMTKVSGGSELVMPMGPNDRAPIKIDTIPAAAQPLNAEMMNDKKEETINSSPVPGAMVKGAMSEIEFAKELELSNTLLNSMVCSCKLELNPAVTRFYRIMCKWETDINPADIANLKFAFRTPTAKTLSITNEMISNFNALWDVVSKTFLTKEELGENNGDGGDSVEPVVQEYKKLVLADQIPQIDINKFEDLAKQAREKANNAKIANSGKDKNIVNETEEEGMM